MTDNRGPAPSGNGRLSRREIVAYYESRWTFHTERAALAETITDETPPKLARDIRVKAASVKRARIARDEMMRWKYLPDDVFDAVKDMVRLDEHAEPTLWHIIVYVDAEEFPDDESIVTEHSDIPDDDVFQLLGSIREKMRTRFHDEELGEQYGPENEISITPIFEDDEED